jgi:hypothetical protein
MTMSRHILALTVLFWTACCIPAAWSADPIQEQQESADGQFSTGEERIGELRLGLMEKDVPASITCKPQKSKEVFQAATGEYVQTWKYPECGIVLEMSAERKGGAKVVTSITLTSPGKLATGRGIHIGSTEAEVIKVYGRYRDPEGSGKKGKQFVAGSIYDGMIFGFRNGGVVRIFLGAAAE